VLGYFVFTLVTVLTFSSYTEKPKYRCPRCKTQTCSLTCYKRHQQRASCNGQRDPAAYLKRSEWATPSGIDRDYNYLKSVERHVDATGKDVRERGISTGDSGRGAGGGGGRGTASNKKVSKSWVPGSALQKYLSENSIMVEKAPTGMSRQKANLTRVTHKGNVMWTVEWVDVDGKKSVDDECSEGRQIDDLWKEVSAKRLNAEKGKKRKRETEKQSAAQKPIVQESEKKPSDEASTQSSQPGPESIDNSSTPTGDHAMESASQRPADLPSGELGGKIACDSSNTLEKNAEQPEDEQSTIPEYFYLLKPFTASKSIVLIPIDSSGTLTECLRGQAVLEFPTVYVLPNAPAFLPAGFMLEEQYNKMQKAEQVEVDGLLQRTNESTGGALTSPREEEKPLDANSILDMLKRDVGA